MDRRERMAAAMSHISTRLVETARILDRSMRKAGVAAEDREPFVDWTIARLWNEYREERMNQRTKIENDIRQLGLRFPNGTVRTDYETEFALPMYKITDVELEGADVLGLKLTTTEPGRFRLSGKPVIPGDFTLKLRFKTVEGEPASEIALPIAFNPNPRDLWAEKPTDRNIPYFKEDTECEFIKVDGEEGGIPKKDMVAASRRGRSHAHEGKARDDDFRMYHCEKSDWYIMAVADGAGSAKYSRKGSEVACKTAVDHCKSLLQNNPAFERAIRDFEMSRDSRERRTNVTRFVIETVYRGAMKAHEAIKKVSQVQNDTRMRDFHTTLMLAICKRFDFGWFIASFWVGDGAMCLFDQKNKTAKLLGTPDEGEFSGQTRFLTMSEIFRDPEVVSKRMRMAIVDDFTALFLMTDGVSDPMFETDKNLTDYEKWEKFYEQLRHGFPEDGIGGVNLSEANEETMNELLNWLTFWSPGNHDDRTIAILY